MLFDKLEVIAPHPTHVFGHTIMRLDDDGGGGGSVMFARVAGALHRTPEHGVQLTFVYVLE